MKKGFTLIELLAVIVILAIIALIASPIIIGLIEDARKESFKNTTYGIIEAGELLYSNDLLNGTTEEVTLTYNNGLESSTSGKKLDYNGKKPKSGSIVINSEGQIAIAIHNGTYCTEKGFSEVEVKISNISQEDCIVISLPSSGVCGDNFVDDRDSDNIDIYTTVKIGSKCWMAEDLRYDCSKAGKGYINVGSVTSWSGTNNCGNQGSDYNGLLYQWSVAMNGSTTEGSQGLCPSGWHISTDAEWTTLTNFVSTKPGTKLKAKTPNWDGTDDYGFNALPAGNRGTNGSILNVGSYGSWWSSTPSGSNSLNHNLSSGNSAVLRYTSSQAYGFSVRCILG